MVAALRRAFPDCRLVYLCNKRTELILRSNPNVDELLVYERDDLVRIWRNSKWQGLVEFVRFLRCARRERFDLMIDLSLGERYAFILKMLGVPRRIGFDYRKRGRFLTARLPIDGYHNDHVVEYYRRLLRFMGVWLHNAAMELPLTESANQQAKRWLKDRGLEANRPLVGMVPAGGVSWGVNAAYRRWTTEGFARVADALVDSHQARIVLFGEKADQTICQKVADQMHRDVLNVSGQTDLEEFVALLGKLDLVICNDGGPLHLAVSQHVKTVSIFGPVDPKVYGPYTREPERHRVIRRYDLMCQPCYHRFRLPPCPYERACLSTIEPDQVLEACVELLGGAHCPTRVIHRE